MEKTSTGDLKAVRLSKPTFGSKVSLLDALRNRRTNRRIGDKVVPLQVLSDLLWAAQGINRASEPFDGPGRTAGSASNAQEINIYVAMKEGVYVYDPGPNVLTPVAAGDFRSLAISRGQRSADAKAPIRLIYTVDIVKLENAPFQEPGLRDPERQKSYYFVDTGLIAQNVYLAASALGLAAWFHNCDRDAILKALPLGRNELPLFGHTIGYAES
jgi:SagB-type dehydrogenase family enzyme